MLGISLHSIANRYWATPPATATATSASSSAPAGPESALTASHCARETKPTRKTPGKTAIHERYRHLRGKTEFPAEKRKRLTDGPGALLLRQRRIRSQPAGQDQPGTGFLQRHPADHQPEIGRASCRE